MTRPVARKFTVFDGMALVAASAVAMAWMAARFDAVLRSTLERLPSWTDRAAVLPYLAEPVVTTALAAILLLRLRRPRPALARLGRQPGFVACVSALMAMALRKLLIVAAVAINLSRQGWSHRGLAFEWERLNRNVHVNFMLPGFAVVAAWLTLRVGGLWRGERSWVDRAGIALGVWVVASIPAHLWYLRQLFAFVSAWDLD